MLLKISASMKRCHIVEGCLRKTRLSQKLYVWRLLLFCCDRDRAYINYFLFHVPFIAFTCDGWLWNMVHCWLYLHLVHWWCLLRWRRCFSRKIERREPDRDLDFKTWVISFWFLPIRSLWLFRKQIFLLLCDSCSALLLWYCLVLWYFLVLIGTGF